MNLRIFPDSELTLGPEIEKIAAIKPGQRLVLNLPSGRDLAEALIKTYSSGIIAVPIDPRAPDRYRAEIIHQTSAAGLLDASGLSLFSEGEVRESDRDGRIILFTSGSTGDPKGVFLKDQAIRHNAGVVARLHNFTKGRVHASPLPLYHGNALNMSLFASWFHGSTAVFFAKFDPVTFFEALRAHQVQTVSLVPALIRRLLDVRPAWPDELEYVITAAAPLPRSMAREFYQLYGPRLRQGYGLSETVNFSTKMPLLDDEAFVREYLDNDPPVGLPVEDTRIRIHEGEVQIKSPGIFSEYWRNETATRNALTEDGWFRSGDVGKFRGEYLVLNGRVKEVINRGGETIYPVDVEEHWRHEGLKGKIAAFRIENNYLSDDIGLQLESDQPADSILHTLSRSSWWRPSYVCKAKLLTTSTGKPMRSKMGSQAYSHTLSTSDDPVAFDELIQKNARHLQQPLVRLGGWTSAPDEQELKGKKVFFQAEPASSLTDVEHFLSLVFAHQDTGSFLLLPYREDGEVSMRLQILTLIEEYRSSWGFALIRHGKQERGGVIWVEV